jgi:ECF sigma factor
MRFGDSQPVWSENRIRDVRVVPLAEALILEKGRPMEIIALDEALDRLQEKDPRAAKVVECRFLAGFRSKKQRNSLGSRRGR